MVSRDEEILKGSPENQVVFDLYRIRGCKRTDEESQAQEEPPHESAVHKPGELKCYRGGGWAWAASIPVRLFLVLLQTRKLIMHGRLKTQMMHAFGNARKHTIHTFWLVGRVSFWVS